MSEVPTKITGMELSTALAGFDSQPWSTVNHAYGLGEDLPGLLRAFAGGGKDAEEALHELHGTIVHHGAVYAASVHAAPYLARIAACGRQTVDALRLLGCLAESEFPCNVYIYEEDLGAGPMVFESRRDENRERRHRITGRT